MKNGILSKDNINNPIEPIHMNMRSAKPFKAKYIDVVCLSTIHACKNLANANPLPNEKAKAISNNVK